MAGLKSASLTRARFAGAHPNLNTTGDNSQLGQDNMAPVPDSPMRNIYAKQDTVSESPLSRSRTATDLKNNTEDKKFKLEPVGKEMNDKLAALNDNWNSIKKDGLETIKEVRPAAGGLEKKPSVTGNFLLTRIFEKCKEAYRSKSWSSRQ